MGVGETGVLGGNTPTIVVVRERKRRGRGGKEGCGKLLRMKLRLKLMTAQVGSGCEIGAVVAWRDGLLVSPMRFPTRTTSTIGQR